MKVDYFYGAQIERLMKHMIRLFSDLKVQDGFDANGKPAYRRVPCRNGDISRQAAVVLRDNSANKLPSAPFITVTISNMGLSRENVRSPMSDQTVVGVNKKDPDTGQYTNQLEGYYEVERHNPVPWDIEFNVDIWTTNQQNKFELFEQIATLFAPSVPLQLSTNPMDPTSWSYVELTNYTHTSRSFPNGSDYELDISQFQFKTMVYLSLPQKVNRATLINEIVTNINTPALDDLLMPTLTNWETVATDVYTPGNHMISVEPTENPVLYNATLLTKFGQKNINNKVLSWNKLFQYYSTEPNTNIQMRLLDQLENDPSEILAKVALTSAPNVLQLTIDPNTLDKVTHEPIAKFFDPKKTLSSELTKVSVVTRYAVIDSAEPIMMDDVKVQPGSIIQYDPGTKKWAVLYEAGEPAVVNNLANGRRYKYLKQIGWHEVIKTKYAQGLWRLGFSKA